MVGSVMLPLTRTGPGSTVSARELGDLLLAGVVDPVAPRWAGLGLYTVPLAGALILIGAGLPTRPARVVTITAATLGTVALTSVSLALSGAPLTNPGSGAILAMFGVVTALISSLLPTCRSTTPSEPPR